MSIINIFSLNKRAQRTKFMHVHSVRCVHNTESGPQATALQAKKTKTLSSHR